MATVDGVFGSDHVDSNQIPRGRSESTLSFSISRNSMDMEASTKRKAPMRPESRNASPYRLGNLAPGVESPFTVKAKISSSSVVRGSTPRARSPPLPNQVPRPRSPLRPNYAHNVARPVSVFASHAVFPPDPSAPSSDSTLGFAAKAKRNAVNLNLNRTLPSTSSPIPPSVSVTRPVSKVSSLKATNPSSNPIPVSIKPISLPSHSSTRSLTPTPRPDANRRCGGSDDGRSSNLSSHPSSSTSLVSSPNFISSSSSISVQYTPKKLVKTRGTSVTLGAASGHQLSTPSSTSSNNHTPMRVRARLSDFSSPSNLTSCTQSADVSTLMLHSRANSVSSSGTPNKPALTPSPFHRRTPSATFRPDKQSSGVSSISIPRSPQGPPSCSTSPSRPRAHTSSSSSSLKNLPNAFPLPPLSQQLPAPEPPVTPTHSSLSSNSGASASAIATVYLPVLRSGTSDVSALSPDTSIDQASEEDLGAEYRSSVTSDQKMPISWPRGVSTSSLEGGSEGESEPPPLSPFDLNEEKDARMEAKSNRKIADLEITNRSLMVINTQLETEKLRQSREIRELKRRLRESRLILPPGAYRALQEQRKRAAATAVTTNGSREGLDAFPTYDIEDEDDEDDEDDVEPDPAYGRVTALLDQLITRAQDALHSTAESNSCGTAAGSMGTKVLTPDEVQLHYAQQEAGDVTLFSEHAWDEGPDHLGKAAPDLEGPESGSDDSASGFGEQ